LTEHKNLSTVRVTEVEDAIEILNAVKRTEVFKINLQGQCLSDMSATKSHHRSPKSKSADAGDASAPSSPRAELVAASPKRRSKPGAKARREVKALQHTTDLLLQPTGFARVIRSTADAETFRFGVTALRLLQSIVENYLVGIFKDAHVIASHAKRVTLTEPDMLLAQRTNGRDAC